MNQNKLPRPEAPDTKEAGPIVKLLGGSQAKSKKFSIQQCVSEKSKKRYRTLQNKNKQHN